MKTAPAFLVPVLLAALSALAGPAVALTGPADLPAVPARAACADLAGADLTGTSQAASAFQAAAGDVGLRLFGAVFWAAAISSVGSSEAPCTCDMQKTTSEASDP